MRTRSRRSGLRTAAASGSRRSVAATSTRSRTSCESEIGEPTYLDGFARVDYEWSPATRGSLHTLLANDEAEINNSAETEQRHDRATRTPTSGARWRTTGRAQLTTTALLSFTDVSAEREAACSSPAAASAAVDDRRDYDVLGLKLDAQLRDRPLAAARRRGRAQARRDLRLRRSAWISPTDYPFPGAAGAGLLARACAEAVPASTSPLYYTVRGRLTECLTAEAGLRWDEQTYGADADDQLGSALQSRLARSTSARACSRAGAATSSSRASRSCRSRTASTSSRRRRAPIT